MCFSRRKRVTFPFYAIAEKSGWIHRPEIVATYTTQTVAIIMYRESYYYFTAQHQCEKLMMFRLKAYPYYLWQSNNNVSGIIKHESENYQVKKISLAVK